MQVVRSVVAAVMTVATMLAGTVVLVLTMSGPAQASDMDCADFPNQAAAQAFFLANDPASDPHNLDSDGDLVACETLPCPCSTDTTPVPSPTPSAPPPTATAAPTTTPTATPTATTTATPEPQPKVDWAKVVKVIDGDTVRVRMAGIEKRVRMLGLDAPEMPNRCGAGAATLDLTQKLPPKTRVQLVSDPTQNNKDRYGRLLRYITKGDTDTSHWQLRRGNAHVLVVGEPFARVGEYRAAQKAAKQHDLGLWGSCR